jgi:hypothetical protein
MTTHYLDREAFEIATQKMQTIPNAGFVVNKYKATRIAPGWCSAYLTVTAGAEVAEKLAALAIEVCGDLLFDAREMTWYLRVTAEDSP